MIFELKNIQGLFSHLHFRMIFVIRVPHNITTYCVCYIATLLQPSHGRKNWKMSAQTRVKVGLSQCENFTDNEGGDQFFAILCGRLLWKAPCLSNKYFNV